MKIIVPLMTLFLASCGVHNHRYDAGEDAYYEDDYYAYDNYDPYYGYGSSDYSTAGDGVYYNNYNYYPDRWGVTYSNVNYSPYRYPRVGFYFSSGYNCGYSYWSTRCSPGFFGSSYYNHYASSWWPSYGFGLGYGGYGGYFASNYWWYNHWRNRNYYHHRPTQRGYYSARNETGRLINGRYYSNYKNNQPRRNVSGNRSNPNAVYRGRSTGSRGINRSSGNRAINRSAGNRSNRNSRPVQRGRQEAAIRSNDSNYRRSNGGVNSSRQAVAGQLNSRGIQNNIRQSKPQRQVPSNNVNNRYQKPALVASNLPRQRVRQTNQVRQDARANHYSQKPSQVRVKPMNSQAPVYHNNRTSVSRQSTAQRSSQPQRSNVQRSNAQRTNQSNNRVTQPRQQSKPKKAKQPARTNNAKPQSRSSRSTSNRSNSRQRQR